ncbi:MAG: hypothetical protein U0694_25050 [Anaerolineae bacterium]
MATGTSPKFTPVTMGLAMVAGLGLTFMVVALGVGTIQGAEADANAIGLFFAAGLGLLVTGIVGWFAVLQPQKHFDEHQYTDGQRPSRTRRRMTITAVNPLLSSH